MQRTPIQLLQGVQLPNAYPGTAQASAPANSTVTISAFTLNNTTGGAVTVSVAIGGTAAANELVSAVSIAAGASLVIAGLIGHHLTSAQGLFLKASAATSITALVSGYQTTV